MAGSFGAPAHITNGPATAQRLVSRRYGCCACPGGRRRKERPHDSFHVCDEQVHGPANCETNWLLRNRSGMPMCFGWRRWSVHLLTILIAISRQPTRKKPPHSGKIRSANHFGGKISDTLPLTAPSRSATAVSGHLPPNAARTRPSTTIAAIAPHVQGVMRLKAPDISTYATHALKTANTIVWTALTCRTVSCTGLLSRDHLTRKLCGRTPQADGPNQRRVGHHLAAALRTATLFELHRRASDASKRTEHAAIARQRP